MLGFKKLVEDIVGENWILSDLKALSIEELFTWSKSDGLSYDGDSYLVMKTLVDFDKEFWFKLVKCMRTNKRSVFQGHLQYSPNDIVKPFCVGIIH